eukprot:CAMPEP_0182451344 /NCGR_PEP_ID=MMETSP1172-20130603/43669_1 /TAXON_ID=708627 /ORGANISM="Timspurckia oligopyrenoides, Strain CCMP3278" /LENGTH=421 /DNA_ID=CAMNT_0024649113 /DNA_START=1763 /DNA_END=3028 /DNA_ORIENTATION=-
MESHFRFSSFYVLIQFVNSGQVWDVLTGVSSRRWYKTRLDWVNSETTLKNAKWFLLGRKMCSSISSAMNRLAVIVFSALVLFRVCAFGYDLVFSDEPGREHYFSLDQDVVSGLIYVFVAPEHGLASVEFYIDDPFQLETPFKIEKVAPFDLAGTAADKSAFPFDSTRLDDGTHELLAVLNTNSGALATETRSVVFSVQNNAHNPDSCLRTRPESLQFKTGAFGASLSATVKVSIPDGTTSAVVEPHVQGDSPWISVSPPSQFIPAGSKLDFTLSINTSALATGFYSTYVVFSSTENQKLSAATVPVTLFVETNAFVASPTYLSLSYLESDTPDPIPITVSLLQSNLPPVNYDVIANPTDPWFVAPSSGTVSSDSPSQFALVVDKSNLPIGEYTGTFSIQPKSTDFDPILVNVRLFIVSNLF